MTALAGQPEPQRIPGPPLVRGPHPWMDQELAALYDVFPFHDDVPFYVGLAERTGGRVLDLACGTGRLLLPLARVASHVVGVDASAPMLALDLLNPTRSWLEREPGWLWTDLLQEEPASGSVVSRKESVVATDRTTQVRVMRSEYEVVSPDGSVRKRFVEWPIKWTTRFEAEHLLARAGFDVEDVLGGHRGEPYTEDSPALLLVSRRT